MPLNELDRLSAEGEARRDAMRQQLAQVVVRRAHRRRVQRRAMVASVLLAVGAAGIWVGSQSLLAPRPAPTSIASGPTSTVEANDAINRRVQVEIFTGNPPLTLASIQTVRVASAEVRMSDDELLRALDEIGRPAGLASIGDRTIITSPVTDEDLRLQEIERQAPSTSG